ncbi:MAG: DUF4097 domain-containing protein [Acidobacteriia bacterium]|nr:DUF4097 domain-containing protein [Terriglobia bacterium]
MRRQRVVLLAGLAALALGVAARAETRIEKDLKLEPNGRFVLESDSGSVTVTGRAASGAHVVITSNRDDLNSLFDINFQDGAGEARVMVRRHHDFHWPHNLSLHFEVEVPSATSTEISTGGGSIKLFGLKGDSQAKTSGGSVEVAGLTGRLDAGTSGGSIHLREVSGDSRVNTSGGSIEVGSLDGSLRAHTSGGPIRIDRVTGYVEAKTSGGSVRVNLGRGNSRGGDVETSGGSIDVELDPGANLNIDASTSGGSVVSDLPLRVQGKISGSSLHGTLGSGGEMLRLHTSGGSIHLRAL